MTKRRITARALLVLVILPIAILTIAYLANWKKEHTFTADNRGLTGKRVDVVFLGDSITALWTYPQPRRLFAIHPSYVNRGISGDHASLMILRLPQDVFALHPQTVVFLGGLNDLKAKSVPNSLAFILPTEVEASIRMVADLTSAHHERLILCSLTPVDPVRAHDKLGVSPEKIRLSQILTVNAWIRRFSQAHALTYVDLYSAMSNGQGEMRSDLSDDGIHPNNAGFNVMEPLLEQAIERHSPNTFTDDTQR